METRTRSRAASTASRDPVSLRKCRRHVHEGSEAGLEVLGLVGRPAVSDEKDRSWERPILETSGCEHACSLQECLGHVRPSARDRLHWTPTHPRHCDRLLHVPFHVGSEAECPHEHSRSQLVPLPLFQVGQRVGDRKVERLHLLSGHPTRAVGEDQKVQGAPAEAPSRHERRRRLRAGHHPPFRLAAEGPARRSDRAAEPSVVPGKETVKWSGVPSGRL
jgi:hypothetical protein